MRNKHDKTKGSTMRMMYPEAFVCSRPAKHDDYGEGLVRFAVIQPYLLPDFYACAMFAPGWVGDFWHTDRYVFLPGVYLVPADADVQHATASPRGSVYFFWSPRPPLGIL